MRNLLTILAIAFLCVGCGGADDSSMAEGGEEYTESEGEESEGGEEYTESEGEESEGGEEYTESEGEGGEDPLETLVGALPEVLLERFATVEAPSTVAPRTAFAVQVSLTEELVTPETGEEPSVLELPPGDRWDVEVVLSASGFTFVDGVNQRPITVQLEGDSTIARFELISEEISGPRRDSRLFATFWHQGRFLARASRPVAIVGEGAADAGSLVDVGLDDEARGGSVRIDLGRDTADLTVYLNATTLILAARGADEPLVEGVEPLTEADRADLRQMYASLSAASVARNLRPSHEAPDGAAMAVDVGRKLWQRLAPDQFKNAFWDQVDTLAEGFESIQIYSDDPTMPWELMKPWRDDPPQELGFLGIDFVIARGLLDENRETFSRARQRLLLREFVVLQPVYEQPLGGAALELEALEEFSSLPVEVRPGRYSEVEAVSRDLPAGILHFAGHGVEASSEAFGVSYSILLEDRPLSLSELRVLLPRPPGGGHPFIFFNACDVGNTHQVFRFAEGWAPTMLEAGASGYVGTLWPVGDLAAARYAEVFYGLLDSGLAEEGGAYPAQLVREARRLFLTDPDPTYLAYVVYGETDLLLASAE